MKKLLLQTEELILIGSSLFQSFITVLPLFILFLNSHLAFLLNVGELGNNAFLFFLLLSLLVPFETFCFKIEVVENVQVFRVFVVLPLLGLLFLRPVVLVIASQHSHLFMKICKVIKVIELSKPQLAVVVIKALFGYSNNASSF